MVKGKLQEIIKKKKKIVYHVNDILISTVLIIFELCRGTAAKRNIQTMKSVYFS